MYCLQQRTVAHLHALNAVVLFSTSFLVGAAARHDHQMIKPTEAHGIAQKNDTMAATASSESQSLNHFQNRMVVLRMYLQEYRLQVI